MADADRPTDRPTDLPPGVPDDVIAIGPRSGLQYVRITEAMADELEDLELTSFPTADPDDLYCAKDLVDLARQFPQGTFVGFDGPGREHAVACGLGIRVHFDLANPQHHVTDMASVAPGDSGDREDGTWYYGTDVVVRPPYRRRGIGKELYDLRKQVCRELNLEGIVAGGVIPGFADHKHEMTADEYIAEVRAGRLYDPTLTFQLENGFEAPCALADYIRDPRVDNYAALIVWHNPEYDPLGRRTATGPAGASSGAANGRPADG